MSDAACTEIITTKRVAAWGIVGAAIMAASCGGSSESERFEPVLGDWRGTTSEGLELSFRLVSGSASQSDAVSQVSVYYGVLCVPAMTLLGGQIYPLDGRRVEFAEIVAGTSFEFDGHFESETSSTGTVRIYRSAAGAFGQCAADTTLDWTAVPDEGPT